MSRTGKCGHNRRESHPRARHCVCRRPKDRSGGRRPDDLSDSNVRAGSPSMTTPWRKTIRDFKQESTRTVLVIAAIAIRMVGFSAVLSTYAVLTREINKGYLASNPASATLETDAVDDALVSAVLSDHQISEAEARRALYGSIKTGPVQWHELTLIVIKDYENIRNSKLTPDHIAWPPKTGEMLIERDAFHVAGLQIGDTATIRIGQSK